MAVYFAAAFQNASDYNRRQEARCDSDDTPDGSVISYHHVVASCGGYWDLSGCGEVQSSLKLESTHDLFGDLCDDEEKRKSVVPFEVTTWNEH